MKNQTWLRLVAGLLALALVAAACGDDDAAQDTTTTQSTATTQSTTTTQSTATTQDAEVQDEGCAVGETDGNLAMYNWAEYIDEDQLADFASEYGISYTLDTYDSNEAMQPIVSAGGSGYDVIVPSDYMVSILIAAGSIAPLDFDAIPNAANISAEFEGLYYDPEGAYSVPYQWGTTGVAVNTAEVGTDFPRSWGLIFDPAVSGEFDGRIQLLNDPRETMGAALKYLGYSLNTTSDSELAEATDLVRSTASRLAAFNTDSADEFLTSGETVIGHGYSGDLFVQFLETDNPEQYVYFVPEEGGTRWIDNMAIPFDAPHPCTAHTFINWILSAEEGARLANYNYYITPNEAAFDLLDQDLIDFISNPDLYAGGVASLEEIEDTGDFEINYTDAFIEAKG